MPLPKEIAKDHHFALRYYNEKTDTFNYLLCKWYKPHVRRAGKLFFKKTVREFVPPNPEDLVIAVHGDTDQWELIQYKDITPSQTFHGTDTDRYTVNIMAIVVARIERLVK